MKTYYYLFILFLSIMSCKEEETGGIPVMFSNYFQIVDAATGKDWFLTHPNYNLDSIKLFAYDQSNDLIPLELSHQQLNDKLVFGPFLRVNSFPIESLYLLQLNAEDTDTIRWVSPACHKCDGKYLGTESFIFYYNGKR